MHACFTNNFYVQSHYPCLNLSMPYMAGQGEVGEQTPKRKNKGNTEFGVGGLVVPRFGGAQHYPRSLAHVYLG